MSSTLDEERVRLLREAEWEPLSELMAARAQQLFNTRYYWRGGGDLPQGNSVEDIVQTVIEKAFSGDRDWNPDKVPLKVWLLKTLESVLSDLFDLQDTKSRHIPIMEDDGVDTLESVEDRITDNSLAIKASDPEVSLIEKDSQKRQKHMADALLVEIGDDELLKEIYFEIADTGNRKPQDLAEKLTETLGKNVTVTEVNNALKRLDRRVRRLAKEMDKHHG